ncbi:ATP-binding cassette domain-containing protein, partial [Xanthomonas citri pv. citri]|nr:ATP-binding cassette domain-containing protein [Xanthomonas citri pv. citri]
MRMVGLDPNEKKSFRKYSLGMKQKLGIAAAMMEDPQILVLDEPFNALDEASCENVKRMILSAKVPDRVVLLSCHDKNQINALCD